MNAIELRETVMKPLRPERLGGLGGGAVPGVESGVALALLDESIAAWWGDVVEAIELQSAERHRGANFGAANPLPDQSPEYEIRRGPHGITCRQTPRGAVRQTPAPDLRVPCVPVADLYPGGHPDKHYQTVRFSGPHLPTIFERGEGIEALGLEAPELTPRERVARNERQVKTADRRARW